MNDCAPAESQTTPQPEMSFSYTDIADAPPTHRNAARALVAGCSVADAATMSGVGEWQIERMLRHAPFMAHVQSLHGRVAIETAQQHAALSALFSDALGATAKATKKLAQRLDSEDCDTAETVLIMDKVHAVSQAAADRLPGRAFTKVSRNEMKTVGLLQVEKSEPKESPRAGIVDRFKAIEAEAVSVLPAQPIATIGDPAEANTGAATSHAPADEVAP